VPGDDGADHRPRGGGHPAGVARVARALAALEPQGWITLTHVPRPGAAPGGPTIDHLVVGPGGVVVLDTRAWSGRIEVSRGAVQQNGFWRERETAAVAGTAGRVAALLLPQYRTAVHAVICVAQHDLVEHVVPPGVHVVGVSGLPTTLRVLPPRLSPAEVFHLVGALRGLLVDGGSPEQLTTAALAETPATVQLFVPVDGGSLRAAARAAGRTPSAPAGHSAGRTAPPAGSGAGRGVPTRRRAPRSRPGAARLLALAIVVALAVLLGAGAVRSVVDASGREQVPLPGPSAGPTPGPSADPTATPSADVTWPVPRGVAEAMTASDDPAVTLAPPAGAEAAGAG